MDLREYITAVIPTSPLVCHPSTEIIDETYYELRKHMPEVKLIILCDGVHPEEEYLRSRYNDYLDQLNWYRSRLNDSDRLIFFKEWKHQSGMLCSLLNDEIDDVSIRTPLVFWSEHDIPLNDLPIDWESLVNALMAEDIGAVRFELTGDPMKETQGKMKCHGAPITFTHQFVGWPHLFRLDYLKSFVDSFGDAKTYLECSERGAWVRQNFKRIRYGVYTPEGDPRRCYHISGRERGAPNLGKPYIEIDGGRRYVYETPYKPAEGV